jgi:DNA-binding MarR family transcriptional regulator
MRKSKNDPAVAAPPITAAQYESLASFRRTLRHFLSFSQQAARAQGLTPQQHQALLAIKGFSRAGRFSVGDLAASLQLRPHSAVGLVDRLAKAGLLRRVPSQADRRRVDLRLTSRGDRIIERLSAVHLAELRRVAGVLKEL